MKLYYSRGACSLASHIVLHEIDAPFTVEAVDNQTKKTASGGDYLQVNPKGYVPALQLDDGQILTEAAIVMQYLADQKPESKLLPAYGTMERYRVLEWTHFVSTEVHKGFSPLFAPDTPQAYKEIVKAKLNLRLTYVDQQLAGKDYLTGPQFTIADAYLFTVSNWIRAVGLDPAVYPNLALFKKRVSARPAVQTSMRTEGLLK